MRKSTVIEISKINDSISPSNAQFSALLREPLQIYDGDALVLRNAFLQEKQILYENIYIEQDTQLNISFGCWEIPIGSMVELGDAKNPAGDETYPNYVNDRLSVQLGNSGAPNVNVLGTSQDPKPQIYYLCDANTEPYIQNTNNITIPKGSYDPNYLALLINKQLNNAQPLWYNNTSNSGVVQNLNGCMFSLTTKAVTGGGTIYDLNFRACQKRPGDVDYDAYAYGIGGAIYPADNWIAANGWIVGAEVVGFEFDQTSNRFIFRTLHTPCYADSTTNDTPDVDPPQEVVILMVPTQIPTLPLQLVQVPACSGVYIQSLNVVSGDPRAWIKMGFSANEPWFVPPPQDPGAGHQWTPPFNMSNWQQYCTSAYCDNSMQNREIYMKNYNLQVATAGDDLQQYYQLFLIPDDYNSLYASKPYIPYQIEASPYYLIELVTNIDTDYRIGYNGDILDAQTKMNHIIGLISHQYSVNNIITAYSDSSITYIHSGEPKAISSFTCRILKPDKTLADDLEKNNSIFLQYVPNNNPVAQPVTDEQEKMHLSNESKINAQT